MKIETIEQAPLPGRPEQPVVEYHGDLVVVDALVYDLSQLADGDILHEAEGRPFEARREAGELILTVRGLGEVVPSELAQAPEVSETIDWGDLDDAAHRAEREQRALQIQVNAERNRRLVEGASFKVSWQEEPIPMTGRQFDQTVILGLLQRSMAYHAQGVTSSLILYRDAGNTVHRLTPAQFIELAQLGMNWVESVMAASWAMKDGEIPADFADDKHWP